MRATVSMASQLECPVADAAKALNTAEPKKIQKIRPLLVQ
jgi:hypothetical protein